MGRADVYSNRPHGDDHRAAEPATWSPVLEPCRWHCAARTLLGLRPTLEPADVTDIERSRNQASTKITVQNAWVLVAQLLRDGRELRSHPVRSADGCAAGPEHHATAGSWPRIAARAGRAAQDDPARRAKRTEELHAGLPQIGALGIGPNLLPKFLAKRVVRWRGETEA
jgi:hypothetical protein